MENKEFFPQIEGAEMNDEELEEVIGGIAESQANSKAYSVANSMANAVADAASSTAKSNQIQATSNAVANALEYSTQAEALRPSAQMDARGPLAKFFVFVSGWFKHSTGNKKEF